MVVMSEVSTVVVISIDDGWVRVSANIVIPWSSAIDNADSLKHTFVAMKDKITHVHNLYKYDMNASI